MGCHACSNSLRMIDFTDCEINKEGVKALMRAMADKGVLPNIGELCLIENQIGEEGVAEILNALERGVESLKS